MCYVGVFVGLFGGYVGLNLGDYVSNFLLLLERMIIEIWGLRYWMGFVLMESVCFIVF